MRERLDYLLANDPRSRWRIILTSAVAIAIFGFICQSSGATIRQAQVAATSIGAVVFCLQVLLYSVPVPRVLDALRLYNRGSVARFAAAIAASGLLAFLASSTAPAVQAAVLNRRLRAAISAMDRNPVPPARDADQIFDAAFDFRIRLRSDLVAEATRKLEQQSNSESWQAYVSALTYTVNQRYGTQPWQLERLEQITTDAPVCGPRNTVANVAEFVTQGGRVTEVHDVGRWPIAIMSCRLPIDGRRLENTQLDYSIVEYHGGPLHLNNIRFTVVKFDIEDTPNGRKFADALLRSESNVLTIDLE
jgi:hypothetical protein